MGIRSQYFFHRMVDFQRDTVLFPNQNTHNCRVYELVSAFTIAFISTCILRGTDVDIVGQLSWWECIAS